MTAQLNHHEWEKLSAYLDGRGSRAERERMAQWIARDASAQDALSALENTQAVFRALHHRTAPRNFRLTPDMVKPPAWFPAFNILRTSSALAAVALAALLVADYLPFRISDAVPQAPASTEMSAMILSKKAEPGGAMIITWGGIPAMGAYGKGGGGGAEATVMGIGGGAGPAPAMEPAVPAPLLDSSAKQTTEESGRTTVIEPTPLEGSEPLLGIAPAEERGKIISTSPNILSIAESTIQRPSWLVLALTGIALSGALGAWVLWRRLPAWLRAR